MCDIVVDELRLCYKSVVAFLFTCSNHRPFDAAHTSSILVPVVCMNRLHNIYLIGAPLFSLASNTHEPHSAVFALSFLFATTGGA